MNININRRWFKIGIGVKRWIVVLLLGMVALALALLLLLREWYPTGNMPRWMWIATLQFWSRPVRAAMLALGGVGLCIWALVRLKSALAIALSPFKGKTDSLAESLWGRRVSQRGPRVVALGGGHGLSTLLSGLKLFTDHITAVVSVADDGGSSGRIRRDFGILPPGDIRRCLASLADAEPLMRELFEHRFGTGEGLEGHVFGNLFITALAQVTGSFEEAVREANRVLAVRGQIVPATLVDVTLWAELEGEQGEHIRGESNIAQGGAAIKRVYLQPPNPPATRAAIQAIYDADLVVVGPGSLYTSLLANLLVGEISQAIRSCTALRVYVCNVATEPGETDHFGVLAHIKTLTEHLGPGLFDLALVNSNDRRSHRFAPEWQGRAEVVPFDAARASPIPIVTADVINVENPLRHDPVKVARELMRLVAEARPDEQSRV